MRVDATCVILPVDRYDWILDVGNKWGTVDKPDAGPSFVYQWGSCGPTTNIAFKLTVFRGSASSTSTKIFLIGGALKAERAASEEVRFRSQLELPGTDGSVRGDVLVNGALVRAIGAQPVEIVAPTAGDETAVEAVVVVGASAEGYWRFDFARPLAPDGLRIVEGNVVSSDSRAVVFRMSGRSGERVRFRFRF